jgi:hypothetical protein
MDRIRSDSLVMLFQKLRALFLHFTTIVYSEQVGVIYLLTTVTRRHLCCRTGIQEMTMF